jgi:hypothetical protein
MTEVIVSSASTTLHFPTTLPFSEPSQDLRITFPWLLVGTTAARALQAMADQAWFWTPEWQEGEREADEDIAAGRTAYFDSTEEFLAALDRETS